MWEIVNFNTPLTDLIFDNTRGVQASKTFKKGGKKSNKKGVKLKGGLNDFHGNLKILSTEKSIFQNFLITTTTSFY